MVIEIKVTPRRLERFFFITLLLIFMGTTVYYAYQSENDQEVTGAAITGQVVLETESVAEEPEVEEVVEEVVEETVEEPVVEETNKKELSGQLKVDIAPLKYDTRKSGAYEKAVVDRISFVVDNGLDDNLRLTAKIFAFDRRSPDAHKVNPKDEIEFPLVKSGARLTRTFEVKNLNLYNIDLDKTIKFEFFDEDDNLMLVLSKTLTIDQ